MHGVQLDSFEVFVLAMQGSVCRRGRAHTLIGTSETLNPDPKPFAP